MSYLMLLAACAWSEEQNVTVRTPHYFSRAVDRREGLFHVFWLLEWEQGEDESRIIRSISPSIT